MRHTTLVVFCATLAAAPVAMAQKWEVGGAVGGSFFTSQTVTNPAGNVDAKFANGLTASAWVGNTTSRWGGELRYDFRQGDMQLTQGGTKVTFGSQSHAVHYDVVYNAGGVEAKVRPFVAGGAGVILYRGTGTEVVYQPLGNIALLTKTTDLRPLISAGAGIKFHLSSRIDFRVEVHDFMSPFPKEVIAPNFGSKVGGWLHDIVPMAALSVLF